MWLIESPMTVDIVCGVHLFFVILGMGPALYYDLRSFHRIARPIRENDLRELRRIHAVVSFACAGLWVSGAALIYIRTGYDFASFSPKLWCKVAVVTCLMINALVLTVMIVPALARSEGQRLIDLPPRLLVPMTLCAGVSLTCWILALILGSSVVLKTANWDVLAVVIGGCVIACIGGVLTTTFGTRMILHRRPQLSGT